MPRRPRRDDYDEYDRPRSSGAANFFYIVGGLGMIITVAAIVWSFNGPALLNTARTTIKALPTANTSGANAAPTADADLTKRLDSLYGSASAPAAIPTAPPEYQQTIVEQSPHAPRSVPTEQPAAPVEPQPQAAPAVEQAPVAIPTAAPAVQASYTSRTQGACSMPRANPKTCAQPIPPMATPVGVQP